MFKRELLKNRILPYPYLYSMQYIIGDPNFYFYLPHLLLILYLIETLGKDSQFLEKNSCFSQSWTRVQQTTSSICHFSNQSRRSNTRAIGIKGNTSKGQLFITSALTTGNPRLPPKVGSGHTPPTFSWLNLTVCNHLLNLTYNND